MNNTVSTNVVAIQELQSIVDEEKQNLSDGSYLTICELTQKIMNSSVNSFYEVEYLESYITKKDGDTYVVEFKNFTSYVKLSEEIFKKITEQLDKQKYALLCTHAVSDMAQFFKINKQQIYSQAFCDECSEFNDAEVVIKNNIIILKVVKI
jgi:hypothetical protein